MRKVFFIALLMFCNEAFSFILLFKDYRLAKPTDTKFKISTEGCTGTITNAQLEAAMKKSIELWNDVPESRLRLKLGGTSSASLASNTAPAGEIIIGCASMGAGGSLGTTIPFKTTGSAAIRINSDAGLNAESLLGTVAHELGHAIGLHHSKDPASLMTYEENGWTAPSYLSQDDVDGVTYLYPNEKKLGGLIGDCSSFASDKKHTRNGPFTNFIIGFLGIFFFYSMLKTVRQLWARMFVKK